MPRIICEQKKTQSSLIDGVPRVTSIITRYHPYPFEVAQKYLDAGTDLHAACERVSRGEVLDQMDQYYLQAKSYQTWLKYSGLTVYLVEERLTSEALGCTGKPDAIFRDARGNFVVCDLKSGALSETHTRLQTACYALLLSEQVGVSTRRIRRSALVNLMDCKPTLHVFGDKQDLVDARAMLKKYNKDEKCR